MEKDTQNKIFSAAIDIFIAKGLHGARMQDIADKAGVNKAMLHYYFRNKKELFERIFQDKLHELFTSLHAIIQSKLSFEDKIRAFVREEIDFISAVPSLPLFLLNEINQDPTILSRALKGKDIGGMISQFKVTYEKEFADRNDHAVPFDQFMMNMMSLCIYPIIASRIFQTVLNKSNEDFQGLVEQRKELIPSLLLSQPLPEKIQQ